MCHVASGPQYALEGAPKLIGSKKAILSEIKPVKGEKMTFTAPEAIYPARYKNLKLIPFFRIGGARYMLYWQHTTRKDLQQAIAEDRALDKE